MGDSRKVGHLLVSVLKFVVGKAPSSLSFSGSGSRFKINNVRTISHYLFKET